MLNKRLQMQTRTSHVSPFAGSSKVGKTMLLEVRMVVSLDWEKLLEGT